MNRAEFTENRAEPDAIVCATVVLQKYAGARVVVGRECSYGGTVKCRDVVVDSRGVMFIKRRCREM